MNRQKGIWELEDGCIDIQSGEEKKKKDETQNLLHITTLCSKQSDILSCCLVGQITTYTLDISLHYSTTLR